MGDHPAERQEPKGNQKDRHQDEKTDQENHQGEGLQSQSHAKSGPERQERPRHQIRQSEDAETRNHRHSPRDERKLVQNPQNKELVRP